MRVSQVRPSSARRNPGAAGVSNYPLGARRKELAEQEAASPHNSHIFRGKMIAIQLDGIKEVAQLSQVHGRPAR